MKSNQKEENKEKEFEDKIQLSKTTQIIVGGILFCSLAFKLSPLATGIFWAFAPLVIVYDVEMQKKARKEGVTWS